MSEAEAGVLKKVTVLIHGHVSEFFPGKKNRLDVEVPRMASVNEILDSLGVHRSLVMFVISDGFRRDREYVPGDGEEITVVSPPSGG